MDTLLIGPKIKTETSPYQKRKSQILNSEPEESSPPRIAHGRGRSLKSEILSETVNESPKLKGDCERRLNPRENFSKNSKAVMPLIMEFSKKLRDRSSRFIRSTMLPMHFKIIRDLSYFDPSEQIEVEIDSSNTWIAKDIVIF